MSVGSLVATGPLLLAIPVAVAAGAVTFLSPCVLPLVPGYLSYITGMSGAPVSSVIGVSGAPARPALPNRSRMMAGAALFVAGFSAIFAIIGISAYSIGSSLLHHKQGLSIVLGILLIVLGLLFAGIFDRFSFTGRILRPSFRPRAGLATAPLLGALFGISWTPCSGPTLSAVLVLGLSTGTAAKAGLLAFVYGLGIGIPFLLVAFALQRGVTLFGFARRHGRLITRIGGLLLILVGVLEVTGVWSTTINWLQLHWLAGYNSPI